MTLKPRSSVPIPQQHPLEESRIQRDHDSFKVKAVTKVDRLVQKVILSQIPIVEVGDGRIRVQKRNPMKSSQFNNNSPCRSVTKENAKVEANPTRPKVASSFDSLKPRQFKNTVVNADSGKEKIQGKESNLHSTGFRPIIPRIGISDDYFEEFKRIQSKMDYVYKPPQAPKYYLWDDTGICNPKNVEYKLDLDQIELTDLARKGIESSKIRMKVLRDAGSNVEHNPVLIGEKTDQNSLVFDQVEENSSGKFSYSAFIVYESNDNKYFRQNRMDKDLLKLKEWLEDSTSVLKLHFPLFLHIDDTDSEVWQTIVAEYLLSMKQIRTISFVANDVYLNLSQGISQSENVGYLSIDQARKLYLISCRDSAAFDIPLIGIWMRMDELKLDSCAVHILHFLTNQSIKLMDIGRNVALVCIFISSELNQPLLFECSYVPQGDWPFKIYQKEGKEEHFEIMKVENCADWNQYYPSTNSPSLEPIMEAQHMEVPNPEASAPALTNSNDQITQNINMAHPPQLNSTSMNSDNQNLLCLSLLQQQMISLQNHVYQLTLMNQQRWKSDSSMADLQKSNINPKNPKIEKMKAVSVAVNTSFSLGSPKVEGKKVEMISVQTNTTIIKVSESNDGQLRIVEENNMGMPASRITTPAEIVPIDYEHSSPKFDNVNRDISFAQNVIQKLVSTADQSFIFKEFEDDECSQFAVFGKFS